MVKSVQALSNNYSSLKRNDVKNVCPKGTCTITKVSMARLQWVKVVKLKHWHKHFMEYDCPFKNMLTSSQFVQPRGTRTILNF